MTGANRMQAARKAAEARRGQVAALRPAAVAARAMADTVKNAAARAETIRKHGEQMRALLHLPGFFPTPPDLVRRMLDECGSLHGYRVLEPSAGRGDIASAARAEGARVTCYELVPRLVDILRAAGFEATEADFMTVKPDPVFDFVLMNPPFERQADRAHVRHAFEFLAPGGILVAIVGSTSGAALREWADLVAGGSRPSAGHIG